MGFLSKYSGALLSILRIMSALLFMAHGTAKLLGFPATEMFAQPPEPMTLIWFAGVLELVGGALLAIGLFTRPVAFVLSGMMAVAYWMAHAPQAFYPIQNQGELAIMFCFTFLYMAAAGGGSWSVDNMIGRKG
ncbi:DoxX family protein [Vitreimonas flagellata]|uniref:DoxX family protein n=1 Tax=Vitreimonas flagellata TaxID=2560861 RepID=UPI00107539BD|nr:DoxX family protein [Vitreimonas flagellata]